MKELAEKDPDEFNELSRLMVGKFLDLYSPQHKEAGRCLQFRIDSVRRKYKHPLVVVEIISRMMTDKWFVEFVDCVSGKKQEGFPKAEVLRFKPE